MERIGLQAVLDDADFQKGIKKYQSSLDTAATKTEAAGRKMSGMFKTVAATALGFIGAGTVEAVFGTVTRAIGESITAASNLAETMSKTRVIFGSAADALIKKSEGMVAVAGQSKQTFLDAVSTFGIFGKSAGLTGEQLAGFSSELAVLASDLASFNNTTVDEAILALGAALRGESEPIRRYGVLLDDASLRQEAMRMGIVATTKDALTPQQRVLAAHSLILKQTSVQQGDFIRTSDGLANQQRILKEETENLKAALGEALIPAAIGATKALTGTVRAVNELTKASKEFVEVSKRYNALVERGAINEEDFTDRVVRRGKAGINANAVQYQMNKALEEYERSIKASQEPTDLRNQLLWVAAQNTARATTATNSLIDAVDEYDKSGIHAAIVTKQINDEMAALNELVGGKLGPEMEDFTAGQADLEKQMADVQAEIDKAIEQGYDPLGEKVMGLQGEYDELKTKYDENADAHDEATKRILFDILTQQAAVDGLTSAEVGFLTDIATSWGLIDQETADATKRAQEAMDYVNKTGDFEGAKRIVEGQATTWGLVHTNTIQARDAAAQYRDTINGLQDKSVDVYVYTHYFDEERRVRQHGGPVQSGQSYIVGEAGPEMFVPNQSGMIIPNSAISNYSISNNNGHSVNIFISGTNISSGMGMNDFLAQLEYAMQRALA